MPYLIIAFMLKNGWDLTMSSIKEKIITWPCLAIVSALIAFFSLYAAQFLNRLDDVLHKDRVRKKKNSLHSWFVVYIAHGFFTIGIILTFIFVCLQSYQWAIKLGVSAFCAGYAALIVSSVQMLVRKLRLKEKNNQGKAENAIDY